MRSKYVALAAGVAAAVLIAALASPVQAAKPKAKPKPTPAPTAPAAPVDKAPNPKLPLKPEALVVLPDYCNTTDGMALNPDGSFILSVPNFNDETQPPLLMKIGADNKATPFYKFPTPYPGLDAGLDRIRPMGIARSTVGDLYLADMQYMKNPNGKSRLWKLMVRKGEVMKMTLVADGFNVANGVVVHGNWIFITESVLEEGSHPLTSAVLRFRIGEEGVHLKSPLKDDPHVIATFSSKKDQWRFGADGIAFDSKNNLFVGLFGEGQIWKCTFDGNGKVNSNKLFAESADKLVNCDGMSCDLRNDKLFVADSAANAIRVISPDGKIDTVASNADVTDKTTGLLDQPCEALVRGNTIVASNMDWPFPGMVNSKHQQPAVLSVIRLK